MRHLFPKLLLSTACTAALAFGQTTANVFQNTLEVTPELRRVDPPNPKMSGPELEATADRLRSERAFADAADYYRAAAKKIPSADLWTKLGFVELQMMRQDEARKSFERAIKIDRNYDVAYNNLGVIYYVRKHFAQSIKNYKKAIAIDDTTASYHSNLGTVYFAKKEYDKAGQEYLRAIELDPDIFTRASGHGVNMRLASSEDRARYSYVIAKMFAAKGDTERCLLYLRRAIEDGFPVSKNALADQEFNTIRKDPRFKDLVEAKIYTLPQ